MATFLWMFAWSAVVVAVLGGVLVFVSRTTYLQLRPGLRQALWMLVLLKLITPPLVLLPVLPSEPSSPPPLVEAALADEMVPMEVAPPVVLGNLDAAELGDGMPSNKTYTVVWLATLAALLGAGTLLIVVRAIRQIRFVAHLLYDAREMADPHLQRMAQDIGHLFGIRKEPVVRLVDGPISPMLWVSLRRPILLIPRTLPDVLSEEQLHAVIAHELAHYKRRDHWTNVFVLALTALFWWHPVVWWARREIRAAQELCCDALVINGGVVTRRDYAETLYNVLDYMRFERPLLPQLASGFGSGTSLKRRFSMIANHKLKHRLTFGAGVVVLAFAVMLPMALVRGQEQNGEKRGEGANADQKEGEGEGNRRGGDGERAGIRGTIKKFDLKSRTITVEHRGDAGAKNYQLKIAAKVKVSGVVQKLADLRTGQQVHVQLSADDEVIAVQTFPARRRSREGRIFAAYDKDKNDKVDFKEWCGLKEGKFDKARTALEKGRFDAVDKNRDQLLTFEEFSAWLNRGRRGDGGDGRPANVKVVTITGAIAKTELKRKRENGDVLIVPKYYLTERDGNRVQLPTPRKRDNGILIDKYDLEFFVGKTVVLTGRGRVAKIREGKDAPTRVVSVLVVTDVKEVKKK